ncbi:MAG: hypothetical protein AB2814_07930 [Candidatus Sedimenticola endophacoides]
MPIVVLNYEIHDRASVEARLLDKSGDGILLEHDEGTRQCFITIIYKQYGGSITGIEFYAASDGWQELTTTGYRSSFLDTEQVREIEGDTRALLAAIYENAEKTYSESASFQMSMF